MTQLKQMWKKHDLKEKYDIVIIGAGVHGLAIAYYLAKRGITNIAVLDKNYLGSGNSGRNTAILRANYRTFEGIPFYSESLKLYENLSQELNYNILFSQQGHLTLGHSDLAMYGLKVRADMNKLMGINSKIISPPEIKQLAPTVDTSSHPQYPKQGALYHPPGAVLRHDAVIWGFANNVESFMISEPVQIQYYEPYDGYRAIHTERDGNDVTMKRHLVFMTYLNTVEDGGGTEFIYQRHKYKAVKGKTLIWPTDWTHTHRGLVSPTEDKHIITGWYSFHGNK